MSLVSSMRSLLLGLALVGPACGDERAELASAARERVHEEGNHGALSLQADDRLGWSAAPAEPVRIYYDLTRYEWYRRGQPLLAHGREFVPEGRPVPGSNRRLRIAGEYQGVAYYVLEGGRGAPESIYVPVHPDYWQRFVPVESQAQAAD